MRVNTFVENRDRVMADQGIPAEKRIEYVQYLGGLCNSLNGVTTVMDEAIDQLVSQDLKGPEAVKYLDAQLEKWDEHFNKSLIESLVEFN